MQPLPIFSRTAFAIRLTVGTAIIASAFAGPKAIEPLAPGSSSAGSATSTWDGYFSLPSVSGFAWGSKGSQLAFVADHDGKNTIYVVDAVTNKAPRRLTEGTSPVWAPDGSRLAYLADGDIWIVPVGGGPSTRLTSDKDDERSVAWSPDGSQLAFMSSRSGAQDVWIIAAAGGRPRQLTRKSMDADELRFGLRWSPKGDAIAFISNRVAWDRDDLWLVSPQGGEPTRLTTIVRATGNPSWSADGRYLAVNGFTQQEFTYGDMTDLYLVDVAARKERKLNLPIVTSGDPIWSPDGTEILFSKVDHADFSLWRVSLDDERQPTRVTYLDGSISQYAYSPDGKSIAYLHSSPERPSVLAVMPVDGGEGRTLVELAPPLSEVRAPRHIGFRSFDGKYIHGFMYLPPGHEKPGAKFPSLVQVHGGGTNLYRNGFNPIEQLLAQKGFVVLAINYRGSSSYGRPFQDLSTLDWCGGQAHDAAVAGRYLRSLPTSNGKVGIYGYSYGGIMSMAAVVRHPDVFDAAVPMGGIYDWALAYSSADRFGKLFYELGHGGSPREQPAAYERSSALNKIQNLKTPVLEMHGEKDVRAPFNQQVALVEALKKHGKEFEAHSYAEAHGFRTLANRVDMYTRLEKWFDKYLR